MNRACVCVDWDRGHKHGLLGRIEVCMWVCAFAKKRRGWVGASGFIPPLDLCPALSTTPLYKSPCPPTILSGQLAFESQSMWWGPIRDRVFTTNNNYYSHNLKNVTALLNGSSDTHAHLNMVHAKVLYTLECNWNMTTWKFQNWKKQKFWHTVGRDKPFPVSSVRPQVRVAMEITPCHISHTSPQDLCVCQTRHIKVEKAAMDTPFHQNFKSFELTP